MCGGGSLKVKLAVSLEVLLKCVELRLKMIKVIGPENADMCGVLFKISEVPGDWPWFEVEIYGTMERQIQDFLVTLERLCRAGQSDGRYSYTIKSMLAARDGQLKGSGLANCASFKQVEKTARRIQLELEASHEAEMTRRAANGGDEWHTEVVEASASQLNDEALMPPPKRPKKVAAVGNLGAG